MRRNAFIYENKFLNSKQVHVNVVQQLESYQEAVGREVDAVKEPWLQLISKKWQKPQLFQIKFNWDATVKVTENCSGFGGLARDDGGEVLAAFSSSIPSTLQPCIAEAMAFRITLTLSKELGFTNVLFEGDYLQVVNAVNNQPPVHDALWSINFDIHRLLESKLNWKVAYVPRDQNSGTDSLTNYACITKLETIWMEDFPSCIELIVQEEKHYNPLIQE